MKDKIEIAANDLLRLSMIKVPYSHELAKTAGVDVIFGEPIKVRIDGKEIPIAEWEVSLSMDEFSRLESLVRIKFAEIFIHTLEQHLNERYSNEE